MSEFELIPDGWSGPVKALEGTAAPENKGGKPYVTLQFELEVNGQRRIKTTSLPFSLEVNDFTKKTHQVETLELLRHLGWDGTPNLDWPGIGQHAAHGKVKHTVSKNDPSKTYDNLYVSKGGYTGKKPVIKDENKPTAAQEAAFKAAMTAFVSGKANGVAQAPAVVAVSTGTVKDIPF